MVIQLICSLSFYFSLRPDEGAGRPENLYILSPFSACLSIYLFINLLAILLLIISGRESRTLMI